jgi:2-hydroxychromene-2-carboxylate isomerase
MSGSTLAASPNTRTFPTAFPQPDPIVQDLTTLDVAEHQPYIRRLTRLGAAAQVEARALAFVDAISRVLWDGTVSVWNEGDHLARAADAAGFDLAAMDAAISADPDRYERVIADNEKGPPGLRPLGRADFRVRERAVLRQDRFDLLIWRMKSRGLTRRN